MVASSASRCSLLVPLVWGLLRKQTGLPMFGAPTVAELEKVPVTGGPPGRRPRPPRANAGLKARSPGRGRGCRIPCQTGILQHTRCDTRQCQYSPDVTSGTRSAVAAVDVAGVDLLRDVGEHVGTPIGDDDVRPRLELVEVPDDLGVEEGRLVQLGLVDDHLDALGLDPLHHALHRRHPEVVRAGLHDQPVDADDRGLAAQDVGRDEVLAGGVGLDDRADQVLRHLAVVRLELPGVLRQAVAAVPEGRVVVVRADPRVQADPLDDLPGVEAVRRGVRVELVEVRDAQREVGVGEELDRLGLRRAR